MLCPPSFLLNNLQRERWEINKPPKHHLSVWLISLDYLFVLPPVTMVCVEFNFTWGKSTSWVVFVIHQCYHRIVDTLHLQRYYIIIRCLHHNHNDHEVVICIVLTPCSGLAWPGAAEVLQPIPLGRSRRPGNTTHHLHNRLWWLRPSQGTTLPHQNYQLYTNIIELPLRVHLVIIHHLHHNHYLQSPSWFLNWS